MFKRFCLPGLLAIVVGVTLLGCSKDKKVESPTQDAPPPQEKPGGKAIAQ
jgi:hypothetical protein